MTYLSLRMKSQLIPGLIDIEKERKPDCVNLRFFLILLYESKKFQNWCFLNSRIDALQLLGRRGIDII